MDFIEDKIRQRWTSGPYVIAQYPTGFFVYRYFKYRAGKRNSKRLHRDDEPLPSLEAAKLLIQQVANQPIPDGIVLINAPIMEVLE